MTWVQSSASSNDMSADVTVSLLTLLPWEMHGPSWVPAGSYLPQPGTRAVLCLVPCGVKASLGRLHYCCPLPVPGRGWDRQWYFWLIRMQSKLSVTTKLHGSSVRDCFMVWMNAAGTRPSACSCLVGEGKALAACSYRRSPEGAVLSPGAVHTADSLPRPRQVHRHNPRFLTQVTNMWKIYLASHGPRATASKDKATLAVRAMIYTATLLLWTKYLNSHQKWRH